jgi:hypothetical protein
MPAKLSIEEVKKRIEKIHNGRVALDESTYVSTHIKARFIDSEFGEWFSKPNDILQGKSHPKLRGFKSNKNRLISIEEVKKRLVKWYEDLVTIDESTYINMHIKARFIDKDFGEWWAIPGAVCKGHGNFDRKCVNQTQIKTLDIPNPIGTYGLSHIPVNKRYTKKIPFSGIYCILNTRNGLKYIGLSDNLINRFNTHKSKLRRNIHPNPHLQYSWNKYGGESFTFLAIESVSVDRLEEREQYWINKFKTRDRKYGYNIN